MNTPHIRPHPQGGYTIAVPVPGAATARRYVGHYSTRSAAQLARMQLAAQPIRKAA